MVEQLILTLLAIILGMTEDQTRLDAMNAGDYDSTYSMAVEEGWVVFEDGTIAPPQE